MPKNFFNFNLYELKQALIEIPLSHITNRDMYFQLTCSILKFICKIDKEKYISTLMWIFFHAEYKKNFIINLSDCNPLKINYESKIINKIISESLNKEYKILLKMYLSNYSYKRISEHMKLPEHIVIYKICFIRKSLSDIFREI